MPTTRRSTGSTRGRTPPTKGQSTLSFHSKVTKNVPNDAKKAVVSPAVAKVEPSTEEPVTDEVDDVVEPDTKENSEDEADAEAEVPQKSESELRAEEVTDAQIAEYWRSIEKQRIAPQIHQEGVSTNERILRYFDVSSHYGVSPSITLCILLWSLTVSTLQPCIGIDRTKRWHRAERLGLKPPIEVLAVLMREDEKKIKGFQKAHMEKIMNSIAVGSAS